MWFAQYKTVNSYTVIHKNLVHFRWLLKITSNIVLSNLNPSGSADRCDKCHSDQDAGLFPDCPAIQGWGVPSLLCPTVAPRGHFGNWRLLELPSVYMHQLLTMEFQNTTRYSNGTESLRPPPLVEPERGKTYSTWNAVQEAVSRVQTGEKVTLQSNASAKLFFQKRSVPHQATRYFTCTFLNSYRL